MGFISGSVTFRRFAVIGKHPKEIDEKVLKKLEEHVLRPGEFGVPGETEHGWCGGRHVFDGQFSFERNVFNDAVHCAMRVDTNRVPNEIKKAYAIMEEEAAASGNPSGFASKKQKRDVKDVVRRKVEHDLKSGKFRRSKLVPVLWDFANRIVYSPAGGRGFEMLFELFERTFELELSPLSAGVIAHRELADKGRRRDYEDARPTRFVKGPEGEGQKPDYPWTISGVKGAEGKDFLGNEFLLWLWHEVEMRGGVVKTEEAGEVAVVIDRLLELDCAYGMTGRDALRGDGPTRMPEAMDALRTGKVPRKASLIIENGGKQFELTLNPESFSCSGTKLPEVEEAEDARVLFEERIASLRDLSKALDAVYGAFLKHRASSSWEGQTGSIRKWIMHVNPSRGGN